MSPKALAYLLILRWVIAFIFLANGYDKLIDSNFGTHAENFFIGLRDDVYISPYKHVLNDIVIPNAYTVVSFIKYSELGLAVMFFIGWPLKLATLLATFLHLNYLCIAKPLSSLFYLNIIMIVAEWATMNAFTRKDA